MSARVSSGKQSRQDYETPLEFIQAVESRLGANLTCDLAHNGHNRKAESAIKGDSLSVPWPSHGYLWLNPPYSKITPWAAKCEQWAMRCTGSSRLFFLVPASVGSEWFANHVHRKALVLALRPRLSFDGVAPFPKDLMLCVYGEMPGFDLWRWK